MASASWRSATFSRVTSPTMRTAEAGPGEGLAPHDLVGQAELGADAADLVLEQAPQRLDQLEVHVVGQAADVVVALDDRGVGRPALDDVGVERALHEEAGVGEPAGVLLEHPDEQLADRLALLLRVGHARQPLEEAVAGVDVDELDALVAVERLDDLGRSRPCAAGRCRRRRR